MGCCLLQPPEGGGAALVVEIGESVIQNDGDGLFRWQHQLADSQPGGEVELIRGPGGQKLDVPVNGVPGGAGSEVKAPVQGGGGVASLCQLVEDLRRPAAELRGEAVLQDGVCTGQSVHGQTQGVIFLLKLTGLALQRFGGSPQPVRIPHSVKLTGQAVGGGTGGGQLDLRLRQRIRDGFPTAKRRS